MTVGTAYALKQIVHERRPDGSDFQSFPSETTALSASGSSFLWARYGWTYGLPAFAATQFVSYSRVQAKKHHWYDTLASSAIAAGYGYVLTTPFKRRYNVDTSLSATRPAPMCNCPIAGENRRVAAVILLSPLYYWENLFPGGISLWARTEQNAANRELR